MVSTVLLAYVLQGPSSFCDLSPALYGARFVVPPSMDDIYRSDKRLVWAVHTDLLVHSIVPCVSMLVLFDTNIPVRRTIYGGNIYCFNIWSQHMFFKGQSISQNCVVLFRWLDIMTTSCYSQLFGINYMDLIPHLNSSQGCFANGKLFGTSKHS